MFALVTLHRRWGRTLYVLSRALGMSSGILPRCAIQSELGAEIFALFPHTTPCLVVVLTLS